MTHSIQTPADIEGMRVAGKLAAECLMMIEEHVYKYVLVWPCIGQVVRGARAAEM